MVQKKSYSRYFIILQEDEKGYAPSGDKMPSGYVKLETKNDKCKICFYIQNVKKDSTPYLLILICDKPECKKIISLGEVNIEEPDRNEYIFEYPFTNIADTGISTDKISGAGLIRTIDKNIISILSGFTSSEIPMWKDYEFITKPKIEEKEEIIEDINKEEEHTEKEIVNEVKEESNVENKFDDYEEMIEKVKQEEIERQQEPNQEEEQEVEKKNEEELRSEQAEQPVEEIHEEPKQEVNRETVEKEPREFKKSDKTYNEKVDKYSEFFNRLVEGFHEEDEVCTEIKNTKWYKISADELKNINQIKDVSKYAMIYYPMMSYYPYISKYGHFLLGYKYKKCGTLQYIIYGIPGRRNIYDQPYGGKSGFVTWIPSKDYKTNKDAPGYWIMFFDFKNSAVAIPLK